MSIRLGAFINLMLKINIRGSAEGSKGLGFDVFCEVDLENRLSWVDKKEKKS